MVLYWAIGAMQTRQGLYAPMSRRVMVVGAEALGASLGEAATGAVLGGSSKYISRTNMLRHVAPGGIRLKRYIALQVRHHRFLFGQDTHLHLNLKIDSYKFVRVYN